MFIANLVVTTVLAGFLVFSAVADFLRYHRVLEAMARAGVPESWLPMLGALKAAAALGLLAGLAVPAVGIAAAVGTIVFFIGAIITHLRARYYAFAPPTSFLLLGLAALVLTLGSA